MILKEIKIIAIIVLTLITLQSIGHSSGLTFKQDPNRVTLNSYNVDVDDDHPAAANKWRSKPIDIEGVMSYPKDSESGPFPVIIYLLSSGGYDKKYDGGWVKQFNDAGYATLMVNQYTARGISLKKGLGSSQDGMGDISFLSDVYAAIRSLKKNPKIDQNRIATFGMSWGGGVQIFMTSQWYTNKVGDGDQIQAHIALAPACYMTVENPVPTSSKMLMILGEKDNWNEPGPCIDYADKLNAAGGSVEVIVIPDAVHGFDLVKPKKSRKAMTWHCQITWDPKTMKAYHKREGKEADYSKNDWGNLWDDCSKTRKVTTGGTPAQRKQAEEVIFSFLNNNL